MWKTIFGCCIYKSTGGVLVYQNPFYRWLCFNNKAIQSAINRKHPEKPVLKYLPALCALARQFPGTTCMLGLGGAAAGHYIAAHNNNQHIMVVENNPEVISIAKQYFMAETIREFEIINDDAKRYLMETTQYFKHLIVDLYDASSFPDECNNDLFFNHCYQRLEKNGFLEINLANPKEQFPIFKMVKKQFNDCTVVVPVKNSSNMIILACRSNSFSYLIDKIQKSLSIKRLVLDPYWGYIAETV